MTTERQGASRQVYRWGLTWAPVHHVAEGGPGRRTSLRRGAHTETGECSVRGVTVSSGVVRALLVGRGVMRSARGKNTTCVALVGLVE